MVVLNEAFNVVEAAGYTQRGEVVTVADVVSESRVMVLGHTDDERVVNLAEPLRAEGHVLGPGGLGGGRRGQPNVHQRGAAAAGDGCDAGR